jgi:hypothetical protein
MPEAPVSVRVSGLEPHLTARVGPDAPTSGLIRRDLERYYAVLADSLREVNLTQAEASLVVDAMNGTLMEPHSYRLLWASVSEAIHDEGLDEKWDVDGPALVEKLRALSPGATLALVDACERYWQRVSRGETAAETSLVSGLQAVGLVR